MEKISSFFGKYRFLSNFYPATVILDGYTYPTSEHAYQASRTLVCGSREMIQRCKTPGEAKKLGRRVPTREDWHKIKVRVMFRILQIKFLSDSDLAKQLIETDPMILEEGNTWGDQFWGICNGEGKNYLGRLLMELRKRMIEDKIIHTFDDPALALE